MKTIKQVAKETGYGASTITRFASETKVQKTGKTYLLNDLQVQEFLSSRKQAPQRKGNEASLEDVNNSSTKTYTARRVSEIMGISYATVVKYAKAFGIPSDAKNNFLFTRSDINELVDRVVQKASLKEALEQKKRQVADIKLSKDREEKTSDLISGLKHNFKKRGGVARSHRVDIVDVPQTNKIDLLNTKLKRLEMMITLTELDIERETLALEIDKVMG